MVPEGMKSCGYSPKKDILDDIFIMVFDFINDALANVTIKL